MPTLSDIKVGMQLTNDSKNVLNVYGGFDATAPPELQIQPGQEIGTVLNLRQEGGNEWVMVKSAAIDNASPWYDKLYDTVSNLPILSIVNDWIVGDVKNAGAIQATDLLNAVSDAQITAQNALLAQNAATNPSITKDLVSAAKNAADVVSEGANELFGGIGWKVIAAGIGLYILTKGNVKYKKFSYSSRK
jgi:hypothetical protein